MYRGFDTFSGGRFHNTVEHAIHRLKFLTQVNTKHYETVLNEENREFYRELNARTRFFIRFETSAHEVVWLVAEAVSQGISALAGTNRTSRSGGSE